MEGDEHDKLTLFPAISTKLRCQLLDVSRSTIGDDWLVINPDGSDGDVRRAVDVEDVVLTSVRRLTVVSVVSVFVVRDVVTSSVALSAVYTSVYHVYTL